MEEKYEKILRAIYEMYVERNSLCVEKVDIGREGAENYHWLIDQGYITDTYRYGKGYLDCHVTQKAIDYFLNKER